MWPGRWPNCSTRPRPPTEPIWRQQETTVHSDTKFTKSVRKQVRQAQQAGERWALAIKSEADLREWLRDPNAFAAKHGHDH